MPDFNGGLACVSWLKYLVDNCGASALFGEDPAPVLQVAPMYETSIQVPLINYCAEVKLKGKPGLDLSVQYPINIFRDGFRLTHPDFQSQSEFFARYASLLNKANPAVMHDCYVYLEADTSRARAEDKSSGYRDTWNGQSAIFINLAFDTAYMLLPEVLHWIDNDYRTKAVIDLMKRGSGYLDPWIFGFMYSRREAPLRLTMRSHDDNLSNLLQGLKAMGCDTLCGDAESKLRSIDEAGIFYYMLDLDIMPDGSLGKTVGVEVMPRARMVCEQQAMFKTNEYKKFKHYLKEWKLADDRMDVLESCNWSMRAPDVMQPPYHDYSFISHFKLRWQGDSTLPAKTYMQLWPVFYQRSINESILINGREMHLL